MKKYEYKFVEVPKKTGWKVKAGETFEECKQVILTEVEQGWRLKQVITPFVENSCAYVTNCYQIIFEREA